MIANPLSWKPHVRHECDWPVGLGVVVLACFFAPAQASASNLGPTAIASSWRQDVLEVTVDGATWAQTIPFKSLANSSTHRKRFLQSAVTVQQNIRPDGPSRSAQASFKGKTWLRWGEGTAPLMLDGAAGWPYRLVVDRSAVAGQASYRWSTADTSQQMSALPNEIQKIDTPDGAWCSWFTVTGTAEMRPHLADGRVPRIHWMLWHPSGRKNCL